MPDTVKESWMGGDIIFDIGVFEIGVSVALLDVTPLVSSSDMAWRYFHRSSC
jgi:hypothetical protein